MQFYLVYVFHNDQRDHDSSLFLKQAKMYGSPVRSGYNTSSSFISKHI